MNSSTRSQERGSSGSRMRPTVPAKSGDVSWSVGPSVSQRGRRAVPSAPASASAASIPRQQSIVGATMLSNQPLQRNTGTSTAASTSRKSYSLQYSSRLGRAINSLKRRLGRPAASAICASGRCRVSKRSQLM